MGVRASLAFLLLFIAAAKAGHGGVTFWKENFKMTCPHEGSWHNQYESLANQSTYETQYNSKTKGLYHCRYMDGDGKEIKYYFYVKGRVCANCFELDAAVLAVAIVVDVVGTACVMVIIYRFTKKKSSAGPTQAPKAPAHSGGEPSHYEPLNHHTRAQEPYSTINKMG
ncbi:T-cell surface glycoprotein CD3 epsilon chain-like [Anarrhichthys ocellatus]|uniref:T-cell surface glycoprotein CD3 epsilon chain-like n=1 Tax=Anarrhichthys ocellatus TaxID=433405 RepID=UPI0012EE31F6|nr:T-cell surface glycoprotein CD3 epsilon chain-like [Anarrhichthys ocellatus]